MPRRLAVVLVLVVSVAACSAGSPPYPTNAADTPPATGNTPAGCNRPDPPRPGVERLTLAVDGIERVVERVIPPGYDPTTPYPLLLNLHGFSSTIEQQNMFSGLPDAAAERGYVLVTPRAEPATLTIGAGSITAPL